MDELLTISLLVLNVIALVFICWNLEKRVGILENKTRHVPYRKDGFK